MDSILGANSYMADINNRLVKFKKHEDNLIAANRVHEEGITIIVSYNEGGEDVYYTVTCDGRTPFNSLPKEAGGGEAEGTVKSINNIEPDGNGNVSLTATELGAATTADVNGKVAKVGDTMTGPLIFADTTNRSKLILTKYTGGTGHTNAPTAFDLSSVYLHLGGTEYNTNSYRLIGFGYRHSLDSSHAAGVIGYQETSGSGADMGRLLFATRNVTTDVAPTVRLTIETNGDIMAQTGSKFVGDGSGLTNLPAPTVTGAASTIISNNLSSQMALISDDSGKVSVGLATAAELNRLQGVTSPVQAQLDTKGTSNLVIGTTSTTAKAGNWVPTAADIPNISALKITADTINPARLPVVTTTVNGVMLATDKVKLDTHRQTVPAEITGTDVDLSLSTNFYKNITGNTALTFSSNIDRRNATILVSNTGASLVTLSFTGFTYMDGRDGSIPAGTDVVVSLVTINGKTKLAIAKD